jgi:hypothetical protein
MKEETLESHEFASNWWYILPIIFGVLGIFFGRISIFWWEALPFFLGVVGGLISWVATLDKEDDVGTNCILIGIAITVIAFIIALIPKFIRW